MIVLLRHCERDMNNQMFDSLLLEEGLLNSETNVVNQLEKYEFDYIYSSPYIRCLQTLKPYIKFYNKSVKIDYNLCESFENIKDKSQIFRELSNLEELEYNVSDTSYTCDLAVKKRVKCFIDNINKNHSDQDSILICTHECIIKEILQQKLGYYFGYHEMGKIYEVVPIKYAIKPFTIIIPYIYYLTQYSLLKNKTIKTAKSINPIRYISKLFNKLYKEI